MDSTGNKFPGDDGSRGSWHWSLERLPDSIINELLLKLDLESLCTAACVSRTLRSAVSQVLASRSSLDLSAFYPDSETLQSILGRLKGVKSLTIDCLRVDDFSFINVLGAQIQELNLFKCSSQSHHILGTIGHRCPNLRVLLIEIAWQRIPQLIKSLVVMVKNISYLESLSLKIHGTEVDVYDFQPLYHSLPTTLKTLKLHPVHEKHFIHSILKFRDDRHLLVPVPSFSNPLHSHGACFNLRNLSLVLHTISDELMFSIVESLPCLVELDLEDRPYLEPQMPGDLSNIGLQSLGALQYLTTLSIIRSRIILPVSFKRVNDLGLFILVENCRGLESVKLGGFSKVTDAGFSSILHSCQKLKKFEVRNASLLSDLAFHDMQKVASSLVELRLLSCNLLTSEALEELSSFAKLEVLDMSGCRSIANPCLSYISSLSTLTNLTLAGADISDDGLAIFGRGSSSAMITRLCLKGCKRISEKGIHKLFHGEGKIGNKLLFLDISYMPGISDAAIATVTSAAKALTDLCMRYCFFVTNAAVKMLAFDASMELPKSDIFVCWHSKWHFLRFIAKGSTMYIRLNFLNVFRNNKVRIRTKVIILELIKHRQGISTGEDTTHLNNRRNQERHCTSR
nr:F-box protein At-B [Ipomoea batatas]GME16721.1 F-box protein At-B [Ipomoea batatas]